MDLISEFFDLKRTFEKVVVPGSQTQGRIKVEPEELYENPLAQKVVSKGTDYAKKYQAEEERCWRAESDVPNLADDSDEYEEYDDDDDDEEDGGGDGCRDNKLLNDVDALSVCTSVFTMDEPVQEELTRVYKMYNFSHKSPCKLSISAFREEILECIGNNQITVLQGSTGCGKSTQVPQYILDYSHHEGIPCNIVVTQPRRLAAISVAKRVCSERNWALGSLVGYQVGLNIKTSPDTRLTFCTTGVLLQRLINAKHLNQFTHIILDEVHERNQDMDFTLMIVRKLLRMNSPNVKVILMSATMNAQRICEYLSSITQNKKLCPAPFIDLDRDHKKKSNFLVSKFYLCQLKELCPLPDIKFEEPGISPQSYEIAFKLVYEFDRLEQVSRASSRGAVLMFLPGIQEIEEMYNLLNTKANQLRWWVRPLHSTITTDEQEMVFHRPPLGHRKIILSTNIAESSLTVPDIVYVIDFCLTKQLVCDPATNFSSLQVTWASKTSCIQRAGRAGRICEGRVYRLVPRIFYEDYLSEEQLPEILRCPLDRVVLQAKLLNMGSPKSLLAICLNPPDLSNIENTILMLKEAGALLLTSSGKYSSDDGDLTFMGYVMAKLPVDIHVGKLIILGHVFNVLEESIIIGAALSLKSMFSAPFQERMAAYQSKLTWADSSCSDCIAFLNAYKVWWHNKENGVFSQNDHREETWARRYFLQLRTLREVATLVAEIKIRLEKLNILIGRGKSKVSWNDREKPLILKIVVAGAFYPNFFVRSSQGGQVDEKEAVRQVVGRDPCNTVVLQGMPMDQPGELYVRTIKKALTDCGRDMKVSFDGTSKVFVQFGRPSFKDVDDKYNLMAAIPGKVGMPVYRAVKLRQLRIPITLDLMPPDKAMARARSLGLEPAQDNPWKWEQKDRVCAALKPVLPGIQTTHIALTITHVVDPGHFWAHGTSPVNIDVLYDLFTLMNRNGSEKLLVPVESPVVGNVYAAPFAENDLLPQYYRARLDNIRIRKNDASVAEVFFIDYGNRGEVNVKDLMCFGAESLKKRMLATPPQAFECVLCEIRPSLLKNPRGLWTKEANECFKKVIEGQTFYGKIYSVVHGVVSLELLTQVPLDMPDEKKEAMHSINKYLIYKGLAEYAEESYLSKANNEIREEFNSNINLEINEDKNVYNHIQQDYIDNWNRHPDPEPPSKSECSSNVTLKGPYSPLEMKIFNLTQVGIGRVVQVEWNSVNSVLLDTDPQDPHERLLVAACVGENADRDRLTIRHTTLMPNIHGLPALIILIFAPTIELRVNDTATHYTGALCGLGAETKTNKPFFPDHDMEVSFDCEITLEDIQDINRLRYWMTVSLYTESEHDVLPAGPNDIMYCQGKVKELLYKLLTKPRQSQELQLYPYPYRWNRIDPNCLLKPGDVPEKDRAIFRLHWGIELKKKVEESHLDHVRNLHELANRKQYTTETITCELCHVQLANTRLLRVHLLTAQHREKELYLACSSPND